MLKKFKSLPREVYIICMGMLLTNLGSYVYPLFVFIATDFGYDLSEISLILSGFGIASIVGRVISGQLTDRFGRKKIFTIFMILSGLMFVLLPLSTKYSFVVMVMIANVFMGISRPAARVMIVDLTTQEQRKEALSLLYMALNVGFSFGPAIGAFLYAINVNILYLGDGITTILFGILILFWVKETMPSEKEMQEHDVKGEHMVEGNVVTVLKQRPELIYLMVFSTFFCMAFCQFQFGLPAAVNILKGDVNGPIVFGILMTINGITVTVLAPVVAKFMENKDTSIGLIISSVAMMGSMLMFAFLEGTWLIYVAGFVFSCGEVIWIVNYNAYEANHTPINHRGRVNTFIHTVISVVEIAIVYVSGILIEVISLKNFWLLIAVFPLIAVFIAVKLHRYNVPKLSVVKETASVKA